VVLVLDVDLYDALHELLQVGGRSHHMHGNSDPARHLFSHACRQISRFTVGLCWLEVG
jgi:hypothetical protein